MTSDDILDASGSEARPQELAGKAVVVAESDPPQRAALTRILASCGMTAEAVGEGGELLALLRRRRFDVVVCDLDLPGLEVLDLTTTLEHEPDLARPRLVLILPLDAPDPETELRSLGVSAWVQRPVLAPALQDAVSKALGLREGQSARPATVVPPVAAPVRGCGRILVVDDNPANRELAADMLSLLGYQSDVAENGREAVDAMERNAYAAVLMDCAMPEMDGFEASREIRRREAGRGTRTTIIAVTAFAMAGNRERCLAAGMDDFVTKPATRAIIGEVLERWIGGVTDPQMAPAPVDHAAAEKDAVVLDREFLLEQVGGNVKLLERVVRLFTADLQRMFASIAESLRTRDAAALAKAAHTLKGGAGNMGARRTAAHARALEESARDQRWDDAEEIRSALEQEIRLLQELLNQELERNRNT